MRSVCLEGPADVGEWRNAARALLLARVEPEDIDWRVGREASLFSEQAELPKELASDIAPRVPRGFLDLVEAVICHTDPGRFALLYRLLSRLQDEPRLLEVASDPDVAVARRLEKSVRRDCHKMTAFVRFREVDHKDETARRRFAAWFEPDHFIVARTAPFFASRFADMDWIIMTPKGTAAFEDGVLTVSDEPAERPSLSDAADALWNTYYASIFNPARLKMKAMLAEMPKKYWKNMPETALIPELVAGAQERVAAMARQQMRQPPVFHERLSTRQTARQRAEETEVPAATDTLAALRVEAQGCTRCPLHCNATQTVFGEGPENAALMFVGEQPGDQEDLAGKPFVGPAGQLFSSVSAQSGIDRQKAYITNAVKHFKFVPRGKRRLHQRPNAGEVERCRWWLDKELALVKPRLVVAMGATAYLSLTGRKDRMADVRGRMTELSDGKALLVTVHPSYLLRIPDRAQAEEERERFRDDLLTAKQWLARESVHGEGAKGEKVGDFNG